ncbi:MAG: 16S rRNA (guanine(527)-N(7))-methyltransferase RsmG [Pseudomonadota bacterium]
MREQLEKGLEALSLEPKPEICNAYLTYIQLLVKWNKTYNLTAIKSQEDMLTRHVFDSLSIHQYIQGEDCLDVGTGAGLPGLILAIAQPDKRWTLLDSNKKKLRFIQHIKAALNINNIEMLHARIEAVENKEFDSITCRAFTSLQQFYLSCHHLLRHQGKLLAMKASIEETELIEIKKLTSKIKIEEVNVPRESAERCIVVMSA